MREVDPNLIPCVCGGQPYWIAPQGEDRGELVCPLLRCGRAVHAWTLETAIREWNRTMLALKEKEME